MLKDSRGQTTLEYILIVIVVISVYGLIMKNPKVKEYMAGGEVMEELATYIQFCYRHALPGSEKEQYPAFYLAPTHKSYSTGGSNSAKTRFFGPREAYP